MVGIVLLQCLKNDCDQDGEQCWIENVELGGQEVGQFVKMKEGVILICVCGCMCDSGEIIGCIL